MGEGMLRHAWLYARGREGREGLTNKLPSRPVGRGVQQPHEAARVAYGLAEPDDGLGVALAGVLGQGGVLGEAVALVRGRDGEDEQQGEGGPRHEPEHVGVVQAVDVVHAQLPGQAEVVQQVAHELRVGLERDEGDAAHVARWCCLCHVGFLCGWGRCVCCF